MVVVVVVGIIIMRGWLRKRHSALGRFEGSSVLRHGVQRNWIQHRPEIHVCGFAFL